jgi:alpha 1,2-mannosyltransferase
MGVSIPSARWIPRILAIILILFFVGHLSTITASTSSESDPTQKTGPHDVWSTVLKSGRKLLPDPSFDEFFRQPNTKQKPLPGEASNGLMNATFVSLVRNEELHGMLNSIREVEDRFNKNWHYGWVFLNDVDFTEEFKTAVQAATSGEARFGKLEPDQWVEPDFIDPVIFEKQREIMSWVKYGKSITYRRMCRFYSGFFYRHEIMLEYEWYWRVEPNIHLSCDLPYDPFRWMAENGKKYSFVVTLNELKETVPTLWGYVNGFMKAFPEHITKNNHLSFLSEDDGETWSYCHFWSNFEIASMDWLRSQAYNDFFNYLDRAGGFFYERWGDASVHSIAAALMLKKGEIHYFDDIGYYHSPLTNCPRSAKKFANLNCNCRPEENMDWYPSCEYSAYTTRCSTD